MWCGLVASGSVIPFFFSLWVVGFIITLHSYINRTFVHRGKRDMFVWDGSGLLRLAFRDISLHQEVGDSGNDL